MTSTFFADTNSKVKKLKNDGTYPVQNRSGLSLVKRGNSKYFVGNIRFPFNRSGKQIICSLEYCLFHNQRDIKNYMYLLNLNTKSLISLYNLYFI